MRPPSAAPSTRPAHDSRAVILIGGHARTVLAVSHSLARHDIPVVHVLVDSESGRIPPRAVAEQLCLPDAFVPPDRLLAALEQLALRWPGALVLPLCDNAIAALAAGHERLERCLLLLTPPAAAARTILDKRLTGRLATQLGIPVPRSFEVSDSTALDVLAPSLPFPLFGKLCNKLQPGYAPSQTGADLMLIQDVSSLRATVTAPVVDDFNHMVQEYCPGHDVMLSVIMHHGRILTAYQARSLRTVPASGGVTVLARSEPVDPVLCDQLARFLRALSWEGIAQADFRRDPATGRTVLLEINGRLWGSVSLALAAGCDFPFYLWQLARGESPTPPARYAVGLSAHWAMGDVKRLVHLRRNPVQGISIFRETCALLAAFRPGVRGMIWRWDDPWPAIAEWTDNIRWFALGAVRRLRGRLIARSRAS